MRTKTNNNSNALDATKAKTADVVVLAPNANENSFHCHKAVGYYINRRGVAQAPCAA